jgi:hypothetical protein
VRTELIGAEREGRGTTKDLLRAAKDLLRESGQGGEREKPKSEPFRDHETSATLSNRMYGEYTQPTWSMEKKKQERREREVTREREGEGEKRFPRASDTIAALLSEDVTSSQIS